MNEIFKELWNLNIKQTFLLIAFIVELLFLTYAFLVYCYEKNETLKLITFIKKNIFLSILLLTIPAVLLLLVFILKGTFSLDEWLSFLGEYFGVIGAIGGIWWQLDKEKKEKEKEIFESQKNTLISFLYLTQNTASRYHDFSEAFLNLLIKNSNFEHISCKTFEYNKILYNNLLFKVPPKFQEIILKTMNKFDDFLLKDYLIKSGASDKEISDFLNEEKKIYKLIEIKLKNLISELSKMSDESVFSEAKTKLDLLVNEIEKIEE